MSDTPLPTKEERESLAHDVCAGHRKCRPGECSYAEAAAFLRDPRLAQALELLDRVESGTLGFKETVALMRRWLDANYPDDTIVCSGDSDADAGARFTWQLRRALDQLAPLP